MKPFFKSLLYFIPFLILSYITLIFIWAKFAPNNIQSNLFFNNGNYSNTSIRLKEVKETENIDVLFLGSSHTYRGFDTRIFEKKGLKVFNLGTSSQTPIQTKLLLSRYLGKLKPKIIIYEVYPETFTSDGVESALDIITNDKNDFYSIRMALELNNTKVYNTLIYNKIKTVLPFKPNSIKKKVKNDTYIHNGYVEKKLSFFKYFIHKPRLWHFNKKQQNAFNDILFKLKNKYKLILVYAPITSSLYKSYKNNDYFDNIMNKYGTYYNFNKILNLNDSLDFYDSNHLNQNGVNLFNSKLIEIINFP